MSSASGAERVNVRVLSQMKQHGDKISMLATYDYYTARTLDRCGVDLLLVGDTVGMAFGGQDTTLSVLLDHMVYHAEIVARAAERAMVIGDMPFLTYQVNPDQAVENAGRLMQKSKVHAVKLEGGRAMVPVVKRILQAGIPVMGHLGLTPQSVHRFGGFRVQGKDQESAARLRDAAQALQEVGCFALVLEAIPHDLATEISQSLAIPTIGIGAGPGCDGQVLVAPDMLGITGFKARYLRRYANVATIIGDAARQFVQDVKSGSFPNESESY
jgi:3-methyl-2-oxobutanoate hydroxymethyltransferase